MFAFNYRNNYILHKLFRTHVFADAYVEHDAFGSNVFEEFLEKLKTIMQTGNDTLGIPVLDPFIADQVGPILIDDEMIKCILI